MFERYTEDARRAIFYARYEASKSSHKAIEVEDVLHGLGYVWKELREALRLPIRVGEPEREMAREAKRRRQSGPREASPYAVEMPFSEDCKDSLREAAAYAIDRRSRWITGHHMLVGLSRQSASIASLLEAKGIRAEDFSRTELEWEADKAAASVSRVGIGYDYHRLVEGRKLVLGGVEIPHRKGLAGHSDGDVLTHALCDALLGAAGLGDLGQHFPDTDPQWKDARSLDLLARVVKMLAEKGLRAVQVDTVILAQEPQLASHFARMRETLAGALGLEPAQVNVKAKTTEGLEAIGRGEAIAAHAIVLLSS